MGASPASITPSLQVDTVVPRSCLVPQSQTKHTFRPRESIMRLWGNFGHAASETGVKTLHAGTRGGGSSEDDPCWRWL